MFSRGFTLFTFTFLDTIENFIMTVIDFDRKPEFAFRKSVIRKLSGKNSPQHTPIIHSLTHACNRQAAAARWRRAKEEEEGMRKRRYGGCGEARRRRSWITWRRLATSPVPQPPTWGTSWRLANPSEGPPSPSTRPESRRTSRSGIKGARFGWGWFFFFSF